MREALPPPEKLPYWKTSQSSAENWLEKTTSLIEKHEGRVHTAFSGKIQGVQGMMIQFDMEGDEFRISYPVLSPKNDKDNLAARRQAATMMYHDVKARMLRIQLFTAKEVFTDYLILENGKTVVEGGDHSQLLLK